MLLVKPTTIYTIPIERVREMLAKLEEFGVTFNYEWRTLPDDEQRDALPQAAQAIADRGNEFGLTDEEIDNADERNK